MPQDRSSTRRARAAACLALLLLVVARVTTARADGGPPATRPAALPDLKLALLPDDQSVYAPPRPPRDDEGFNQGGVNIEFNTNYMTDHVYRGVDHSEVGGHEDAPNLQFDGKLTFNLGKFPHPFLGVFVNVYDSDPISRFQEIRPYVGLEWRIRPIVVAAGHTTYIYPEREQFNTSEVWGKVTLDDSYVFHSDQPILSPYIFGAYDYDLNKGWYFEAGIKHDFVMGDSGLTLTFVADVAYVRNILQEFVFTNAKKSGFQHYDAGLIASYSLNTLLRFPKRFGELSLNGYAYYTAGFDRSKIHADTQVWGGVGIGFKY